VWIVALDPSPQQQKGPRPEFNQFEGVGMTLDGRTGSVLVALVSEGSPAERAGVQAGDQVLAIDGVAVLGQSLEAVVQRIRGPAGTPVLIRFQRGAQGFELTLRRRLLTL
jgi:carboxyl-terminal processing protease